MKNKIILLPLIIAITIIIYLLFFRIYYFSGDTMKNTILDNRYVIINKIKKAQVDDIVLFKGADNHYQLKRIVAGPGDTVIVRNANLYVNSQKITYRNQINKYRINSYNDSITKNIFMKYDKFDSSNTIQNNFILLLTKKQSVEISKMNEVTIEKTVIDSNYIDSEIFSPCNNKDFINPIVVPYKGMIISELGLNKDMYRDIILNEKNKTVQLNDYHLRENYYFLLNDNRTNTNDSRKIGFIPEKNIVGVATYVFE